MSAPTSTSGESEHPHLELMRLWLRCGPRARREFLADVREAHLDTWREVEGGGGK